MKGKLLLIFMHDVFALAEDRCGCLSLNLEVLIFRCFVTLKNRDNFYHPVYYTQGFSHSFKILIELTLKFYRNPINTPARRFSDALQLQSPRGYI